jgi:hypothetical protein
MERNPLRWTRARVFATSALGTMLFTRGQEGGLSRWKGVGVPFVRSRRNAIVLDSKFKVFHNVSRYDQKDG